ncbi:DNA replication/repair protein RecF [Natronospira bacteriovora]|uniref:DNA replication and repair protein RecF n=1 Tax=Natronospira bacteriovora TaxID=3069753 RepID=A0ABU0W8H7_9GAMM|nr:DNA replication/repair protein RecF [Natronospira sp. AB-CW4]MDQ2069760.1 DNA replication/repair protein RecF [Natronospira sp. AB-CW4]
MTLTRLRLRDFRCFEQLDWYPGERWTLISGENASGKTSLLEAIFFLGRGRSFRTARNEKLIRTGAQAFELVGDIHSDRNHRLGVRRAARESRWRLDGRDLRRMADIANVFPVLSIDTGAQVMIEGGPENRRRFLDWGLFHVEQGFMQVWRRYRQALAQRNGAIRGRLNERAIATWDQAVADAGEQLDACRQRQVRRLAGVFESMAASALGVDGVVLSYQSGWKEGLPLAEALQRNRASDIRMGHTLSGPHRAELQIRVKGAPARERVSRGQQKMLAACLLLSGARVFEEERQRGVVVLVDDLPSELDRVHAARFAELLATVQGQCFITGIESERLVSLAPEGSTLFHVEQGGLVPVQA